MDYEHDEFGRIRRAVELSFEPSDHKAVLDALTQYSDGTYVQSVILALAFGDRTTVENLVRVAQDDFRDVVKYLWNPERFGDGLTRAELLRRFQELRLPVPIALAKRTVDARWLQRTFGPKKLPEIKLAAAKNPSYELGDTKIGGAPTWIGEPLPPICCSKTMLFLGQFDTLAVPDSRLPTGLVILVFVCPRCCRSFSMTEGSDPRASNSELDD